MKIPLNMTCLSSSLTSLFLFSTCTSLNLNLPPSRSVSLSLPPPIPQFGSIQTWAGLWARHIILSVLVFESVKQDTTCDDTTCDWAAVRTKGDEGNTTAGPSNLWLLGVSLDRTCEGD